MSNIPSDNIPITPAETSGNNPLPPVDPMRFQILTMQEWMILELSAADKDFVIGTPDNAIVRPKTKNLIEAAEKSFKTTFMLRLLAGLACGESVFPELPVGRPRRVLYLHGELSNAEIKDRTVPVVKSLISQPSPNFWQGRVLNVHLIEEQGRKELRQLIQTYKPEDVALDPWQAFIVGAEENSYSDMSKATQFCNQLIEDYGVMTCPHFPHDDLTT